jgi:hypothetical protein
MKGAKTMNTKKYNGWTNYETWVVNLWITNDSGSAGYWEAAADSAVREHDEYEPRHTVREVADAMQSEIMDECLLEGGTMYCDLIGAAFCNVNWREIAEHFVADARERAGSEVR